MLSNSVKNEESAVSTQYGSCMSISQHLQGNDLVAIVLFLSYPGREDSVSILGHLSIGKSGSSVGLSLLPLLPPNFWGILPLWSLYR